MLLPWVLFCERDRLFLHLCVQPAEFVSKTASKRMYTGTSFSPTARWGLDKRLHSVLGYGVGPF